MALTFLDPVCTSDCPLIAQEFRDANTLLGADSSRVVFVAVVANQIYRSTAFTKAFDRQEGLEHMRNWLFLTGSLSALEHVWDEYGIEADVAAGRCHGRPQRTRLSHRHPGPHPRGAQCRPGRRLASASSSFSVYLATALEHVIHA